MLHFIFEQQFIFYLCSIPMCDQHSDSSVGNIGCFQFVVIMNKVTMDICVSVSEYVNLLLLG